MARIQVGLLEGRVLQLGGHSRSQFREVVKFQKRSLEAARDLAGLDL